jgi:hypothetical protein
MFKWDCKMQKENCCTFIMLGGIQACYAGKLGEMFEGSGTLYKKHVEG